MGIDWPLAMSMCAVLTSRCGAPSSAKRVPERSSSAAGIWRGDVLPSPLLSIAAPTRRKRTLLVAGSSWSYGLPSLLFDGSSAGSLMNPVSTGASFATQTNERRNSVPVESEQ